MVASSQQEELAVKFVNALNVSDDLKEAVRTNNFGRVKEEIDKYVHAFTLSHPRRAMYGATANSDDSSQEDEEDASAHESDASPSSNIKIEDGASSHKDDASPREADAPSHEDDGDPPSGEDVSSHAEGNDFSIPIHDEPYYNSNSAYPTVTVAGFRSLILHLTVALDRPRVFSFLLGLNDMEGMRSQVGASISVNVFKSGGREDFSISHINLGGNPLHMAVALSRAEIIEIILSSFKGKEDSGLFDKSEYVTFDVYPNPGSAVDSVYKCMPLAIALASDDVETARVLLNARAWDFDDPPHYANDGTACTCGLSIIDTIARFRAKKCRDYVCGEFTSAQLKPTPMLLTFVADDADETAFYLGKFPGLAVSPRAIHTAAFGSSAAEVFLLYCARPGVDKLLLNTKHSGMTPLITLAYFGEIEDSQAVAAAKVLLRFGADPRADRIGKTAKQLADENQKPQLAALLKDAEDKKEAEDKAAAGSVGGQGEGG